MLWCVAPVSLAAERPNVVFLFADDMRPDAIAALGNSAIKTPNLDRLVERGFAFRNACCMGSTMGAVCNPSRHMLLSGMSLYHYDPKQAEGTFGDVMRKAGYVTWHLGKKGNTAREYHKAFEFSDYLEDMKERNSGHHGRTAANRAIDFLENGWDREKPLFMYLAFEGPHDPRIAAKEWMDLYETDEIPLPENYMPFHPIDNGWMAGRDEKLAPWPRTPEIVRQHLHDYYACISSIDHHCGRILKTLEDQGELDNTIVIFSSDHGLAMGSHGLFGKQNLYEHSMRSPLIFAGPGIPHGETDAFAYLFDIFPTTCELAGIKPPEKIEGRSQAPVIRGQQSSVRDTIFLAYEQGQRAVRQGDWKLYRFPLVNYSMLFNLASDPHELRNLATVPEHAAKRDALLKLLAEQQDAYDDPYPRTVENPGKAEIDLEFFENPPEPQKGRPARSR
jgi:arylsulfatase A-like enzyme